MAAADRPIAKPRPVYLNLFAIRQPVAAITSILHRASGALLFVAGIPLLLWFVQRTLASPEGFAAAMTPFTSPLGKLTLLVLTWCYLFHLFAGLRHLALDLHIGIDKPPARASAVAVLVLGFIAAVIAAWCIW